MLSRGERNIDWINCALMNNLYPQGKPGSKWWQIFFVKKVLKVSIDKKENLNFLLCLLRRHYNLSNMTSGLSWVGNSKGVLGVYSHGLEGVQSRCIQMYSFLFISVGFTTSRITNFIASSKAFWSVLPWSLWRCIFCFFRRRRLWRSIGAFLRRRRWNWIQYQVSTENCPSVPIRYCLWYVIHFAQILFMVLIDPVETHPWRPLLYRPSHSAPIWIMCSRGGSFHPTL